MAEKKLTDGDLLSSMGFSKTNFEAWDPMKDDFSNTQFNSYDRGPGRNLPRERFKNMGGNDRQLVELYVTGIPEELEEGGLRNLFCQYGDVVKVNKMESKNKDFSGTYGFVGYRSVNEATEAIGKLHMKSFQGGKYQLKVKFAMTAEEKQERARQREMSQGIPEKMQAESGSDTDADDEMNEGATKDKRVVVNTGKLDNGYSPSDNSAAKQRYRTKSDLPKTEVKAFHGMQSVLSNFYPCTLDIYGIEAKSSEHAYQYIKAIKRFRPEIAKQIVEAETAADAKRLSKEIPRNSDWGGQKVSIMEYILEEKAKQVPRFCEELQRTNDRVLAESVVADKFWSSGLNAQDTLNREVRIWPGENKLGILLMNLREKLKEDAMLKDEGIEENVTHVVCYTSDELRALDRGAPSFTGESPVRQNDRPANFTAPVGRGSMKITSADRETTVGKKDKSLPDSGHGSGYESTGASGVPSPAMSTHNLAEAANKLSQESGTQSAVEANSSPQGADSRQAARTSSEPSFGAQDCRFYQNSTPSSETPMSYRGGTGRGRTMSSRGGRGGSTRGRGSHSGYPTRTADSEDSRSRADSCVSCGKPATNRCRICKTLYCSAECQVEDWPVHKLSCKERSNQECNFWRIYDFCHYGDKCKHQHIPENKGIDSHLLIYAIEEGCLGPVNGDECYFWRVWGECTSGEACRFQHKYNSQGIDMECLHWRMGDCNRGDNCKYKHIEKHCGVDSKWYKTPKQTDCIYWMTLGCKNGDECRFNHAPEKKGVDSESFLAQKYGLRQKMEETYDKLEMVRVVESNGTTTTTVTSAALAGTDDPTDDKGTAKDDGKPTQKKSTVNTSQPNHDSFEQRFEIDLDDMEGYLNQEVGTSSKNRPAQQSKPGYDKNSQQNRQGNLDQSGIERECEELDIEKLNRQTSGQNEFSISSIQPLMSLEVSATESLTSLKRPEDDLDIEALNRTSKPASKMDTSFKKSPTIKSPPRIVVKSSSEVDSSSVQKAAPATEERRGRFKVNDLKYEKLGQGLTDVTVTHFESPASFYIGKPATLTEAILINEAIKQTYDGSVYQGYTPEVKEVVACQFTEDNGWYRALVNRINLDGTLKVTYGDFGNSEELPVQRIRKINAEFVKIPFQGIHCRLDIAPSGGAWSAECLELCNTDLMPALAGKNLLAKVVKEEGTCTVIDLIDSITEMSITDTLITKSLAEKPSAVKSAAASTDANLNKPAMQASTNVDRQSPYQRPSVARDRTGSDKGGVGHSVPKPGQKGQDSPMEGQGKKSLTKQKLEALTPDSPSQDSVPPPPPVAPLPMPTAAKWLHQSDTTEVHVLEMVSPDQFWVQVHKDELDQLEPLQESLNQHYSKLKQKKDFRYTGHALYACKFTEDKKWYRALAYDADPSKVSVIYLDFGNREYVTHNSLLPLEGPHLSLPFQAVSSRLYGIEGKEKGKWSEEALNFVRKAVQGKTLKCLVLRKDESQIHIELLNSQGKSLNDALIKKGYANKKEESCADDIDLKKAASGQPQQPATSKPAYPTMKDLPKMDLGDKTEFIVQVTDSVSPSETVVQIADQDSPVFAQLLQCTQALIDLHQTYTGSYVPVSKGELVSAKFEDGSWYRAEVLEIQQQKAKVVFIDYGNIATVDSGSLCKLDPSLLEFPYLGIKSCLSGIGGSAPGQKWNSDLLQPLAKMWKMKVIDSKDVGGSSYVVIDLLDMDSGISLNAALLEGGLVVPANAEANKPSQTMNVKYPRLTDIPTIPIDSNAEFLAQVTDATSPSCIVIQTGGEEVVGHIGNLSRDLAILYAEYTGSYIPKSVGEVLCAKFQEDLLWYRAEVLEIQHGQTKVQFIDYGNFETVSSKSLAPLDESLLQYPCLGLQCSMSGISGIAAGTTWDPNLLQPMARLWKVKVISKNSDGGLIVDIIDNDSGDSMNSALLEGGLVVAGTPPPRVKKPAAEKPPKPSTKSVPKSKKQPSKPAEKFTLKKLKLSRGGDGHLAAVMEFNGPQEFYVQCLDDQDFVEQSAEAQAKINEYYASPDTSNAIHIPSVGELVIAFSKEFKEWYRAEVLEVMEDTALMFFVDYGNLAAIELHYVRKMEKKFTEQPQLAVRCCLFGLTEDTVRWSGASIGQFEQLTKAKLLKITLDDMVNDTANVSKVIRFEDDMDVIQELLDRKYLREENLGRKPSCVTPVPSLEKVPQPEIQSKPRQSEQIPDGLSPFPKTSPGQASPAVKSRNSLTKPSAVTMAKDIPFQHLPSNNVLLSVCHAESIDEFYVQSLGKEENDLFVSMTSNVNKEIVDGQNSEHYVPKVVGEAVVASYMSLWYRGEVTEILGNGQFSVKFVDYGNTETVTTENLRKLHHCYMEVPRQGIKCCFSGIKGNATPDGQWSQEAILWFSQKVLNGTFKWQLNGGGGDNADCQGLDFYMENGELATEVMIEKGFAIPKPVKQQGACGGVKSPGDLGHKKAPKVVKQSGPPPAQRVVLSPKVKKFKISDIGKKALLEECQLTVTDVISPLQFDCQVVDADNQALAELMAELNKFCSETVANPALKLEVGELCCALFSMDQNWYRAEVQKILSPSQVTVKFIDYGNTEQQDIANVRPFRESFMSLAAQAVPCSLKDVPENCSFSNEVIQEFKALAQDKLLYCTVVERRGPVHVVKLVTLETDVQTDVNEALVQLLPSQTAVSPVPIEDENAQLRQQLFEMQRKMDMMMQQKST